MTANSKGGLIFVSCGQVTAEEIKLGKDVCALVSELTPHRPFFAENQSTLEGLTTNILGSLDDAVALIAIMHPRGRVRFPDKSEQVRASVWIEQEVAIAAFNTQILRRPLRVATYIHADVRREGMREQLQLNSVIFREESEILLHLRVVLPSWRDLPASLKVTAPPRVRVALKQGLASNFLLEFTNDEDEEVDILEVKLQQRGVELTEPFVPEKPNSWKVRAHSTLPIGKTITHNKNPAASLVRMNDNKGLFFQTDMDAVFSCLWRSKVNEIRQKLYVRVKATNNEIVQLV